MTELVAHVERTAPTYASNVRRDRTTHPIAFFGDVLTAQALTFGVNPSADEFRGGRLLRHTPNASETLGISTSNDSLDRTLRRVELTKQCRTRVMPPAGDGSRSESRPESWSRARHV